MLSWSFEPRKADSRKFLLQNVDTRQRPSGIALEVSVPRILHDMRDELLQILRNHGFSSQEVTSPWFPMIPLHNYLSPLQRDEAVKAILNEYPGGLSLGTVDGLVLYQLWNLSAQKRHKGVHAEGPGRTFLAEWAVRGVVPESQ